MTSDHRTELIILAHEAASVYVAEYGDDLRPLRADWDVSAYEIDCPDGTEEDWRIYREALIEEIERLLDESGDDW